MGDTHDLHARLNGIQAETARAHREIATHEATLSMLDARLKNCETTDETLATALAQRLDTLTGRVAELESTHATRGVWVRRELDALTASVGVLRADLVSLQAQRDPWPVMLARLESLSDERNAARRDLQRAQRDARQNFLAYAQQDEAQRAEIDALKAERGTLVQMLATAQVLDGVRDLQQEVSLYRALLTRVRSGDLVRCLTCQGSGHCADCEDERGAPRYGVPGLVPPDVNAPLSVDVDLTPEELKP